MGQTPAKKISGMLKERPFARLIAGQAVPFICFRSKEGKWGEPIDIQKYIGNGVCCMVLPDGKYVFIDDSWAPTKFIEELRPKA